MLGVLGKTSLVLLLCVSIYFTEASICTDIAVENCGSCTTYPDQVCRWCKDGWWASAYDKTDKKEVKTCSEQTGEQCFPGSSMVTTPTGNVAMETLNVGDRVLTEIGNNQLGFSKVVGFAQREQVTEGNYLSITAVNQAGQTQTVKMTATHNIYVKSKMADDYIPRFASDVFVGDMLKTMNNNGAALNEATVTDVALHKEMGAYAPLTETGTMLVDGTLVSCYTSYNDFGVHIMMTPIRWFPWLFADTEIPLEGKLPYVEALKHIFRNYVVPFVSLK